MGEAEALDTGAIILNATAALAELDKGTGISLNELQSSVTQAWVYLKS